MVETNEQKTPLGMFRQYSGLVAHPIDGSAEHNDSWII